MTDWGVHLIDPIHQAMAETTGEPMPKSVVALGSKFWVDDNTETPDTLQATFQYDKFLITYESRTANATSLFNQVYGTAFHGTEGTIVLNRAGVWLYKNRAKEPSQVWERDVKLSPMNVP